MSKSFSLSLAFLLLMSFGNSRAQSTGCFNVVFNNPVNYDPLDLVKGDFNNDGKLDIVSVHGGTNQISVLLGTGNGTFNNYSSYTTAYGGRSIVAADINTDGKLDVAMVNGGSIQILLGNGAGGFAFPTYVFLAYSPVYLVSADFNNDGKPDFATVNSYQNYNVSVVLNLGNGNFSPEVTYPALGAYRMVATDFNSDGKIDLATGNANGSLNGSFTVFLGNGFGSFGTPVTFNVGIGISGIAAADLNNDGKIDLAMSQYALGNVLVRLGSGTGNFATGNTFSVGTAPGHLVATDLNGDNKPDLAVANFSSTNVSVLIGSGSGSFASPVNYSLNAAPSSIIAGDFNGDFKSDLAVSVNYYTVSVFLNTSSTISLTATSNSICAGESSTLNVSGASTYTWVGGPSTSSYVVNPAISTSYSVTGTNASGCVSNTATVSVVVKPLPTISFQTANAMVCLGDSVIVSASGATSYTWSNGAQTSTIGFIATNQSNYSVIATNSTTGCSANAAYQLSVSACTGLKEQETHESNWYLYPNPVHLDLMVNLVSSKSDRSSPLEILDPLGKVIEITSVNSDNMTLNVSKLPPGVYFIQWQGTIMKFIKE